MPPSPPPPRPTLATDPLIHSLVRWLLILVFVVIGWWVVSELAAILTPILVAVGIAYLLDPVLDQLVRRGMSRAMGATLLLVGFLGAIAGLLVVLVPQAIDQLQAFGEGLPDMIDRVSAWLQARFDFDLKSHLNAAELQKILGGAAGPLEHLATVALGGVFAVLAVLAEFLLVPVFAYYFLLDWPQMQGRFMKIIPPRKRSRVRDLLGEIDGVVSGWVRGQAIVTSILAILYALAFWIAGVPLAIPIGLVVGALTIIPFVGTLVGAGLTAVVMLLDWPGSTVAGVTAGIFVAFHLLEAAVLTPKIVGHKVGLSESAALFAVVAGGKLLGFVGILLAVPLAATVAVLLRHAVRYYETTEFFGDEKDAEVAVTPSMQVVMMGEGEATGAADDPGA
ncbi:MAG: AI-2E family transporter [Kofleriaceae bacterium]